MTEENYLNTLQFDVDNGDVEFEDDCDCETVPEDLPLEEVELI